MKSKSCTDKILIGDLNRKTGNKNDEVDHLMGNWGIWEKSHNGGKTFVAQIYKVTEV